MKIYAWILLFLLPFGLKAQYLEAGLWSGLSYYQGDIALNKKIFADAGLAYGIFGRYNVNNFFSMKLNVYRGRIKAADRNSDDPYRNARNLHFRNDITELGLHAEFNILGYQPYALEKVFSPYISLGIAGIVHNPQAEYQAEWINLQPLGTEGQGIQGRPSSYSKMNFSIPFGGGVKIAMNDKFNVGIDAGIRYTPTDYLDDLSTTYMADNELYNQTPHSNPELVVALANRSGEDRFTGEQRGDPDDNDWYIWGGIYISYNFLDNGLVGSRNRRKRSKSSCPSRF